ncbi:hypothetical protein GCM10027591_03760 [Zhihengliuella somnathii]
MTNRSEPSQTDTEHLHEALSNEALEAHRQTIRLIIQRMETEPESFTAEDLVMTAFVMAKVHLAFAKTTNNGEQAAD